MSPSLANCPSEYVKLLKRTFKRFYDVFVWESKVIGHMKAVAHQINNGDAKAYSQPPRHVLVRYKEALNDMIQVMLARNIITLSISSWAA